MEQFYLLLSKFVGLTKLYKVPACSNLVYKQLPTHIQFLLSSVIQNDLLDAKRNDYDIYFNKQMYVVECEITDEDILQLERLEIISMKNGANIFNKQFLESLDQSFCYSTPYFTNIIMNNSEIVKQTSELIEYQDILQTILQMKEVAKQQHLDDEIKNLENLNSHSKNFKFCNINYLLLNIEISNFYDNKLKSYMKTFIDLIGLDKRLMETQKEEVELLNKQSQFLRFILGDSFTQARIVLTGIIDIVSNQQFYEKFNKIIIDIRKNYQQYNYLQETTTIIQEQNWLQIQFLIQLINQPINVSLIIKQGRIARYNNILFFLQQLGLVSIWRRSDDVVITVSDVLSLQQINKYQQDYYYKVFQANISDNKKNIYVESTARITYYIDNDDQARNKVNIELLKLFCYVIYDLNHCIVFQLDKKKISACNVDASLICRFLRSNSLKPIPADLINLIDSYQQKQQFLQLSDVDVVKISTANQPELVQCMLYYYAYKELDKDYIMWIDIPHFKSIEEKCGMLHQYLQQHSKNKLRKTIEAFESLQNRQINNKEFVILIKKQTKDKVEKILNDIISKLVNEQQKFDDEKEEYKTRKK